MSSRFNSCANRSDSVLETMVQSIPDPFDSYGPPQKEGQLFSILAPLAMTPELDTPSEGVSSWTDEYGVAFPRTEQTPTEWGDAPGRTRRHSAPMPSSSSSPLATTSITNHAPSSVRRSHLPTILSVIDENRGKVDVQQSEDESPQGLHQSTNNAPENSSGYQTVSSDLTPTNSMFRPLVTTRSHSPPLHGPNRNQDTPPQLAA